MALSKGLLQLLPLEVKIHMCEFLCGHCTVGWNSPPAVDNDVYGIATVDSQPLRNLCLTSKAMRDAAQPVLFHFFTALTPEPQTKRSVLALLSAIGTRTSLSKCMKSLSISLGVLHPIWSQDADPTIQESNPGLPRYDHHGSKLLRHLSTLKELEISFEHGWVPGDIALSQLKELSIHNESRAGAKLDDAITLALLKDQCLLRRLTLTNRLWFDHAISGTLRNLREFCIINMNSSRMPFVATSKTLSETMPQLESFTFREVLPDDQRAGAADILQALLGCKGTLKSLRLDRCIRDSGHLLRKFSKLVKLNVYICTQHAAERYPEFPPLLETLIIQQWFDSTDTPLLYMGTNAFRYPNLKVVYKLLHYDPDALGPTEILERDMVNYNVFRLFQNAGIYFWVYSKNYYEPHFITRSWGRNAETFWVETLQLED